MKRLTGRAPDGTAYLYNMGGTNAAIDRLAAYEDTGLEPEEISIRRWIPVTERLPETPGEYMVAYHPCYWDRVRDEIKVGLDSFRGKTAWAKKKYQRVTHWQPLPEPPEEVTP